jgi:hypothetical protein
MTTTGPDDRNARDEAILAPFFAAARLSRPMMPSPDLISAILADAGEISATRAPAARTSAARAPAATRRPRPGLLAALGGWRVATTLAAASVLGFWIGLSGTVDVGGEVGWTTVSAEAQGDPVAGFFDLASAE